jgi:hypothetical protein
MNSVRIYFLLPERLFLALEEIFSDSIALTSMRYLSSSVMHPAMKFAGHQVDAHGFSI